MSESKDPQDNDLSELEPLEELETLEELEPMAELEELEELEELPVEAPAEVPAGAAAPAAATLEPESTEATASAAASDSKGESPKAAAALPGSETREMEQAPMLLRKASWIMAIGGMFPWMMADEPGWDKVSLSKLVIVAGAWILHSCMAQAYGDKAPGFAKSLAAKVVKPSRKSVGWNVGELLGIVVMIVGLAPLIDAGTPILASMTEKAVMILAVASIVHIYAYSKGAMFNPIVPIMFLGPAIAGVMSIPKVGINWWSLGALAVSAGGIFAVYTLGVALKQAKIEGEAKKAAMMEARKAARAAGKSPGPRRKR